ncbi:MAG: 30S ribosomal protein S16 [Pseudomonadales bacterium]|nr:30S ribosomal protein S16 [Pseudomonadales bacterium]MCP5182777.1 30S ribosomal protein S16 [Pseudomonadales bacterium]
MLTIRLARHGAKKNPFYHITVAESTSPRDGRFVERLGFYSPVARNAADGLRLNLERYEYWTSVGAQPSEKVQALAKRVRRAIVPAAG